MAISLGKPICSALPIELGRDPGRRGLFASFNMSPSSAVPHGSAFIGFAENSERVSKHLRCAVLTCHSAGGVAFLPSKRQWCVAHHGLQTPALPCVLLSLAVALRLGL